MLVRQRMKDQLETPVRDCMVSTVQTLSDRASLAEAATQLRALGMTALPVLDGRGGLVGSLGWSELHGAAQLHSRAAQAQSQPESQRALPRGRVGQFMSSRVPVIGRAASIAHAARRMHERGLRRLYVAQDGALEGVLSTRELMQVVVRLGSSLPLGKLVRRAVATVEAGEPLATATALWSAEPQQGRRRFGEPSLSAHCHAEAQSIVVTRAGQPIGVLTPEAAGLTREVDPAEPVDGWMDRELLFLPERLSASHGARLLLEQRCRYIVTRAASGALALLSGLDFAGLIADGSRLADAGSRGDGSREDGSRPGAGSC